jgi:hypothetical protein
VSGGLGGSATAIQTAAMDGDGVEASTTAAWIERHRQMYERATRHPFTVSIRDGTIDLSTFKRWLVSPSMSPQLMQFKLVRFSLCDASNCEKIDVGLPLTMPSSFFFLARGLQAWSFAHQVVCVAESGVATTITKTSVSGYRI